MKDADTVKASILIHHARLVLPDKSVEKAGLLIRDGRIARLFGPEEDIISPSVPDDAIINLEGLTLFPGFIDVHIHGAVGIDAMEATADDLHTVARYLASCGVTAWLPTLVPAPVEDYQRSARAIEQLIREQDQRPAAARALGLHYEGPFINSAQCGALRPAYFRTFAHPSDLDALATVKNEDGAAHMITVAPETDGGIELVRELRARGWIVSIGHTRADVETLDRACQEGARHMTHFMNAMAPLHHRAPGPVAWGLLRDDVTCDVIADGVHLDPLMLQLVLRCKTARRISLISDAVAPAGLGDGEYRIWGETISVVGGRTRNARGSIAGSVISLRDAVRQFAALGVSAEDGARMAAHNPARLLGRERDYGSIEEGKRADLVALDAEGNVKLTLIGGRVAFDALPAHAITSNSNRS